MVKRLLLVTSLVVSSSSVFCSAGSSASASATTATANAGAATGTAAAAPGWGDTIKGYAWNAVTKPGQKLGEAIVAVGQLVGGIQGFTPEVPTLDELYTPADYKAEQDVIDLTNTTDKDVDGGTYIFTVVGKKITKVVLKADKNKVVWDSVSTAPDKHGVKNPASTTKAVAPVLDANAYFAANASTAVIYGAAAGIAYGAYLVFKAEEANEEANAEAEEAN